ncbi:MAG: hypothetical protein ACREOZ_03890 [Gloeomargaritales cyanobacterium]
MESFQDHIAAFHNASVSSTTIIVKARPFTSKPIREHDQQSSLTSALQILSESPGLHKIQPTETLKPNEKTGKESFSNDAQSNGSSPEIEWCLVSQRKKCKSPTM